MSKPTDKMNELFDLAIAELKSNFKGNTATEKTKRAVSIISVYKGLLQAEAHIDGIKYAILKDISLDKIEFKKAIISNLKHIVNLTEIEYKK